MELNGDGETSSRRVQVRFKTKLQAPMKVPTTSIAIPSNLTRMGLSKIINDLIESGTSSWEPIPFDFIIDGELVRMSLEEFLLAKGISAEKILEIEYIKAVVPNKQEDPCLHDDWVSAVSGANPRFMLTGSYDGFGRLWEAGGKCTHILEGHKDAITSITVINKKEEPSNHRRKITAYKVLKGHTASVQSVVSHPSDDMVCSGSWDHTIKLWRTNDSDSEGDLASTKKRKVGTDAKEFQLEAEAVSTLAGHTQCVSSVAWPEHERIYSASWDHLIRRWDIKTGQSSWDVVCEGSSLIAAGGSDSILRIWDPRKPGTLAPVFQFTSHTSWITACKWHGNSWSHLLSASYDGKVMLWDLRTAWPVAVIKSHQDKVLCADWWKDDCLISGGADSKLCISSGISIL
ncbi:hypothetical protein AQUCO_00200139v1 [Aquilegia coerulea]|uniref:Ribosome biogenesis protein WDR12 homolog n=1 Tax=Aquilegia coerulea TaxID=218851 RepID=A0A2G5F1V2_AQUCA|nr:hypothetical protein AQUCO_00200139v1 [Aquilegia coerulea]